MTHRNQKTFNVIVMSFRNSSFYMQRLINPVLRFYKHYARVYIDDVVIFSKIKKEHFAHLQNVFVILTKNNISINSLKAFIDYLFVILLKQRVTSLKLFIDQQKMKIIVDLNFSKAFDQLKSSLNLID